MTFHEWLLSALALGLGATVQSASGFGMAIVSVPLITASGLALPQAVALMVGATIVQATLGLRASGVPQPWKPAVLIASGQWVGVPLGTTIMAALVAADPAFMRQVIGAIVVVLISLQLWIRPVPRETVHDAWAPPVGLCAGLLSGTVGMGGPPLVFYALAHDWQRNRYRSFLWRQMLLNAPLVLAVLSWRFGLQELSYALLGVACVPVVYAGTQLGLAISRRWQRPQVLRAAAVLLYAVGASALLAPWLP